MYWPMKGGFSIDPGRMGRGTYLRPVRAHAVDHDVWTPEGRIEGAWPRRRPSRDSPGGERGVGRSARSVPADLDAEK